MRGENFDAMLPLLPGVVRGFNGRLSVKGGQGAQTSLRVNSVNVSDPVTGEFGTTPPDDAIDTVRLLPHSYAAEYGGFSAGVSEIETRCGTDESKWTATNFFPSLRFRDSTLRGIGKFRPRVAISGALRAGRVDLAQSFHKPIGSCGTGVLRVDSDGDSRYWELELTSRLLLGSHEFNVSYVRSRSQGGLNVFDEFFGNFRNPIVGPNEFSLTETDARNRVLFRGASTSARGTWLPSSRCGRDSPIRS